MTSPHPIGKEHCLLEYVVECVVFGVPYSYQPVAPVV